MSLQNSCEGDGRSFDFVGIWSKNRREWLETHIALMYFSMTTIGFFDSMGPEAVDYITNQCDLKTMFVAGEYIAKLTTMKKDGLAKTLQFVVSFDDVTPEQTEAAQA